MKDKNLVVRVSADHIERWKNGARVATRAGLIDRVSVATFVRFAVDAYMDSRPGANHDTAAPVAAAAENA
jgi:hypothetical protein